MSHKRRVTVLVDDELYAQIKRVQFKDMSFSAMCCHLMRKEAAWLDKGKDQWKSGRSAESPDPDGIRLDYFDSQA